MSNWLDWEKEEERQREARERFDAFVGPFLIVGLVLIVKWFLYGAMGWLRSDELDALFRDGLSAYLLANHRWWITVAVMTFAGLAGLAFQVAKSIFKVYQVYSGEVIESLAFSAASAGLALFGLLVFY